MTDKSEGLREAWNSWNASLDAHNPRADLSLDTFSAGFKAGLEWAARIIIENEERRTTSTHKAYLGPRDPGNVSGMGFVEAIREEIKKI